MSSFNSSAALMPIDEYYEKCVIPKPVLISHYNTSSRRNRRQRLPARLQSYRDSDKVPDTEHDAESDVEIIDQLEYEVSEFDELYNDSTGAPSVSSQEQNHNTNQHAGKFYDGKIRQNHDSRMNGPGRQQHNRGHKTYGVRERGHVNPYPIQHNRQSFRNGNFRGNQAQNEQSPQSCQNGFHNRIGTVNANQNASNSWRSSVSVESPNNNTNSKNTQNNNAGQSTKLVDLMKLKCKNIQGVNAWEVARNAIFLISSIHGDSGSGLNLDVKEVVINEQAIPQRDENPNDQDQFM